MVHQQELLKDILKNLIIARPESLEESDAVQKLIAITQEALQERRETDTISDVTKQRLTKQATTLQKAIHDPYLISLAKHYVQALQLKD